LTNAESVKARLKKAAGEADKDFNYLLMHYLTEDRGCGRVSVYRSSCYNQRISGSNL
jgi:hypothetical protein